MEKRGPQKPKIFREHRISIGNNEVLETFFAKFCPGRIEGALNRIE